MLGRQVLGIVSVTGDSMTPTFHAGDRLLVLNWPPRLVAALRGAVVIAVLPTHFYFPTSSPTVVKRLKAVRGPQVWLEGDSPHSMDSRTLGWLPASAVKSVVLYRLSSSDRADVVR